MKLMNLKSGEIFLNCDTGEIPEFSDPSLNLSMSQFGIIIPEALQKEFGSKKRVFREDPEFLAAFTEFYFKREMNPNLYAWQ